MTLDKRFCPNCGASMLLGDKFCGSCGRPVSGAAPAVNVSAAGEQIAGIIPNANRKQGMFKSETFNVIVSDRRMVFALLTGDMVRAHVKEDAKKGFFFGVIGALTVGNDYYKKYADMPPEEALKENPENFTLNFLDIRQLKIVEGRSHVATKGKAPVYDESYMEIETATGKQKFILSRDSINNARAITRKTGLLLG